MGKSRFPGGTKPCPASVITNMTDGHRVMKVDWSRIRYSVRLLQLEPKICYIDEGKTGVKDIPKALNDPFGVFSNIYQIS